MACEHVTEIRDVQPKTPEGCEECLAEGARWVQLRMCLVCGHVGCCDSTPGKHATWHFHETGHPVMRAFRAPGKWGWCYAHALKLGPEEVDERL